MTNASALIGVLADPTRRALVEALRPGPRSVTDLAGQVPVSRSAVSQHLSVLYEAGVVDKTPLGTRRVYRLRSEALGELRAYVDGLWSDALDSFASAADGVAGSADERPVPRHGTGQEAVS